MNAAGCDGEVLSMRIIAWQIFTQLVLLVCIAACIWFLPPWLLISWGIACVVTLVLHCIVDGRLARLEQRPLRMSFLWIELLPFLWPFQLTLAVLNFYLLVSNRLWKSRQSGP